ncbi:TPA: VWA domain-containing protein [Candidatus Woesearchaeota archaeon]|nr:VWA domain-containing protein [Candidatus Woesearchaeota archaeon]
MQLTDLIVDYAAQVAGNFRHPIFLWGIPILFIILLALITRTFVRYSMDDAARRKLRRMRIFVFVMRFAAMTLLCIALAAPFTEITNESEGNPRATVLVDKSGSMAYYDTIFVDRLAEALDERIPTTVKEFGAPEESPLGDAMLGQDTHILVVSDGNANIGVAPLDVAQVMRENNMSISMITLRPIKDDTAVFIDAPESVPVGYPATITVEVTGMVARAVPLEVEIDGKIVYNAPAIGKVEFKPPLTAGYHRIAARINSPDVDEGNNAFHRVVHVLEKPKVLVLAKQQGPLENALAGMFDVTVAQSLPGTIEALSEYYAVILDDIPASNIRDTKLIGEFLRDERGGKYGAGLVAIGGFNSFDRGSYGGTPLESILPVKTGKAKRTVGENNIVFVIQVSGSTSATKYDVDTKQTVVEDTPTVDIIKAQAVSAINSLNLKNNVGVVAFGISTEGQSASSAEEMLQKSVITISEVKPLYSNKQELTDKVSRIRGGGTTAPDVAIRTAVELLKDKSGDKTIILLTNGRFSAGLGSGDNVPAKANTLAVIDNARKRYNIKTQTLGVGAADDTVFAKKVDETFLKTVAKTGDGTYDRATNMMSLIVKYGDPKEKGFGEEFALVPLSLTHFITKDLELDAILNGYNEVAPKEGSRMLVSTDAGNPAVTVWNYFNGRVATVTVFTASGMGPLLVGNNSDLLRNTVLWAVGDPMRKQEVSVTIPPAIAGQSTEATFVSEQPISGNCDDTGLAFERSSGDTYVFSFTPKEPGFGTVCGVPYAVNGPSEGWHVGANQDLATAVGVTGGAAFDPEDVDAIAERIRTVSTRITIEKTELRNPFIILAVVLFLLEIFIRRVVQYQK